MSDELFTNKLVIFTTQDDTFEVFNPILKHIQGRDFFIGTIPKGITSNDWTEGKTCAVSLDCIIDFMIFDSIEDYNAKITISN